MASLPTGNKNEALVVIEVEPDLSTVPIPKGMVAVPKKKLTVPVGVPPDLVVGVTLAVNVTAWP